MKLVEDIGNNFIGFGRDNTNPAFNIHTKGELIQNNATKVCTQNADNHCLGIRTHNGAGGDNHTGNAQRLTNIHMQILIHQLADYLQAAGGGIVGKQNGLTETNHQNVANHIQHRILGQRLKIGEQSFKNSQERRHQYGADGGFPRKIPSDEEKACNQQTAVKHKGNQGNRQRQEFTENIGKGRNAANGKVQRQHKKVDRYRNNQRS